MRHFRPKLLLISSIVLILTLFSSCCYKKESVISEKSWNVEIPEQVEKIYFGSCSKQWEDQSYWEVIAAQDPDLWVWLGDIIYSDTEDMNQLASQYQKLKNNKYYKDFDEKVPVIGIWDDHDYGLNDGGSSYIKKKESRDKLFSFLELAQDNPAWKREGAYQAYTYGRKDRKVKVILLDGRYFRDNLKPDTQSKHRYLRNEQGTYLGEEQWLWLENELKESDAQINILVSGVQVLSSEHYFEKWSNFPREKKRLLDLIQKSGVKNPLFVSGDRHVAELSEFKMNSGETIYDLTTSGLTHSYEKANEENPLRISPLFGQKNFASIQMNWDSIPLTVSMNIHSIMGEVLYSKSINLNTSDH